jgi:hypothetical protein
MKCSECIFYDNGCKRSAPYFCYKPKEKEMEKFQFESEEQFRHLMQHVLSYDNKNVVHDIKILKQKGYIRKSELQQMVEEAEEMYNRYCKDMENHCIADNIQIHFYKTIQALKKLYPEFKE